MEMLNQVTHEFRTPLSCIISMLELIEPQMDEEAREQYLQPAMSSGRLLMYLLNDILDLA